MSSDDETVDSCNVRVMGTDIYFYGQVDVDNVMELNMITKKLEKNLLKKAVDHDGYTPNITLHIHSDGGDIFAGMNAMDTIRNSKVHVTTIAEGTCCSAATFILLGGDRRLIGKHAYILIHQMSAGFNGKYTEIQAELDACDKMMKNMKLMYLRETKIPKKLLKQIMKKDIYLDAFDCIKYNIVDEIL